MIPELNGAKAYFKYKDSEYRHDRRVVAWDDDGEPLVCNDGGRLVPASNYAGFVGVEWEDHYIAALPGAGWTEDYIQDDGSKLSYPVIGFLVDTDGWCKTIVGSGDGEVSPGHFDGKKTILTPPGGWGDEGFHDPLAALGDGTVLPSATANGAQD